jgi:hypothetical protein
MQFTKLFNSILDSTIWQEPLETKIVWITMLAMVDRSGEVHASVPGLAKRAGVTIEQCEFALQCLRSPDQYSRTQDHEGRRIKDIDGGWELLNHGKYRALLSAEERREYNRRKQAEYRMQRQKNVNDMSMTVNDNVSCQHITEAEAEAEAEKEEKKKVAKAPKKFIAPSIDELRAFCKEIGHQESDGEAMFYMWESNGWKNGKNPCKDWKAGVKRYASEGWLKSQKSNNRFTPQNQPSTHATRNPRDAHEQYEIPEL